jgi:hypothetical protein
LSCWVIPVCFFDYCLGMAFLTTWSFLVIFLPTIALSNPKLQPLTKVGQLTNLIVGFVQKRNT